MSLPAKRLIEQGRDLHRRGLLDQAAAHYEAALQEDCSLADAWHLLGVATAQSGTYPRAADLISRAISLSAGRASFHRDRGIVRLALHDFESALKDFQVTLQHDPGDTVAAYNRAFALQELGRHHLAIPAYEHVLHLDPGMDHARGNLGNALLQAGRSSEAVAHFEHVLARHPLDSSTWFNHSVACQTLGQYEKSLESVRRACAIDPNQANAWAHMAGVLIALERPEEAMTACDSATRLNPLLSAARANRASALALLGRDEEALEQYDLALKLNDSTAEVHQGRGLVLQRLNRFDEAASSHLRASQLKPDYVDALLHRSVAYHRAGHPHLARAAYELVLAADARHPDAQYNLGLLHYDQERLAEAASWLESAIFNDPDHKLARWNLTLIRLAQGDFRGGWKDYSMRWQVSGAEPPWLDLNRKRWAPGQQSGRVLAWSEQGLGDTILFSGFLDALRAQVPELRAAVDPRLIDLLSRSYPGIDFVSKVEDPSTLEHDHHVPIGDVPYLLSEVDPSEILGHEGESNCFPQPRLVPDWPRAKEIRGTELQSHLRIVGISWRSTHALTGTAKSLALRAFVPLLRRSDLLFVNLQYGEVHDEIEDLERTFGLQIYNPRSIQLQEDLDGLAALICCCDAVVTCSNTTAHLAGALGRKTFLLAPHGRALHWYWRNRNSGRSRWYPSVSIIDQSPIGSWEYSVEQLLHRV